MGVPAGCCAHGDILQILERLDVAAPAHHVFRSGKFQHPSFHIAVALADGFHDFRDGNIVGAQAIGIDGNLVLIDKAADAGHL